MNGDGPFPEIPGFAIRAVLGRGATATVYRAVQTAMGREVALKVADVGGAEGRRRALRLFREARTAGALDHPLIARGIDAGETGTLCWFAMELVEGRTLEELLRSERRLPWRRVATMAVDVLDALGHAHARGVVHRDLKPSNLVVGPDGRTRVLDLGLATREDDPRMTQEGGTVGTPRYMAPEQALHPRAVDGRADLFSLGATMYAAVAGVPPFGGATVAETLTRLLYDAPRPLATIVPAIPSGFAAVVERALEKNPADRFSEALFMAEALRGVLAGRAPSPATPRRRRAAGWIAIGAAVVAAVFWATLRKEAPPDVPVEPPRAPAVFSETPASAPSPAPAPRGMPVVDAGESVSNRGAVLDDLVEDVLGRLEAVAADPGRHAWTARDVTARLDAATSPLPEDAGSARRIRVDTMRRRLESTLADEAIARFSTQLAAVRASLGEGKLAEARSAAERLGRATDEERVPGAAARIASVKATVAEAAAGLAAVLDALPAAAARGSTPLDASGRAARCAAVRGAIDRAIAAGPLEETTTPRAAAEALSIAANEAASMRADWLAAASEPSASRALRLVSRRSGAEGALPTLRKVVGRRDRRIVFVKESDGLEELWDPEELSASTVVEGLRAAGRTVTPTAEALLLHWDGDDLAAREALRRAPTVGVAESLRAMIDAGVAAAASAYRTPAEREGFSAWLEARRLLDAGAYLAAAEVATGVLTRSNLAGTPFLREHRDALVALASRARALEERGSRLRPFGKSVGRVEAATGRVRLEFDFRPEGHRDGVVLPDGAVADAQGLRWPGRPGDPTPLPEDAPALRIPLPDASLGAPTTVDVVFDMPPPEVPFAFVAMRVTGWSALLIGELRDGRPFVDTPLHGLEDRLVAVRSVAKGVLAGVGWADLRRAVFRSGATWVAPPRDRPATLRFETGRDAAGTRLRLGETVIVAAGLPVGGAAPGIELRLPPGVRLRSIAVETRLLPPESK